MDRRTFFGKAVQYAVGSGLRLLEEFQEPLAPEIQLPAGAVRPPGALEEERFVQLCTGCDLCMVACPHNVVMVQDLEQRLPVIYPEKDPCLWCSGLPCVAACPTGALSEESLETV